MSFVFVQLSHDYADEFNMDGAFVAPKPHFEQQIEEIKKTYEEGQLTGNEKFYFGTNEYLQFNDFEDFMSGVTVKECTEQFYDEFKALTGGSIGHNVMDQLIDHAHGHYK